MVTWRLQLNAGLVGPQAWLFLAIRRGLVREAGVTLELLPGHGAWNAAARMQESGAELGHGDLYRLLALPASGRPVAVLASHNRTPSVIARPRGAAPALARVIGHASDVARQGFAAYAQATGRDPAATERPAREAPMAALLDAALAGEADGVFGYASTQAAALAAQGRDLAAEFELLRYDAALPDLYGSALFASPAVIARDPARLSALLGALRRALAEAVAEPEAALDALLALAPSADRRAEGVRWRAALAFEMGHPEAATLGRGGVAPERFARGLAGFAAATGLPALPPEAVFDPRPLAEAA